ncbi:MAG TPA: MGMT family protein [Anaerolineales bacterium]|nr:MGMT family protein [Anaerolineales bacterium]
MDGGLPLYERIYAVVRKIPSGRVTTYGHISRVVGGCSAQMVGYALAGLRADTDVPWQRVINAKGRISPRGGGPGAMLQQEILEEEGIEFEPDGSIDFERFGWFV